MGKQVHVHYIIPASQIDGYMYLYSTLFRCLFVKSAGQIIGTVRRTAVGTELGQTVGWSDTKKWVRHE